MEKAIICLIKSEDIINNLMKELSMKEFCNQSQYNTVQIFEKESFDIDEILKFVEINNIDYVIFYKFEDATNNLLELKKLITGLKGLSAAAVFLRDGIDTSFIIGTIINKLIDSLLQYK